MRENTNQNNFEYRHFSRSVKNESQIKVKNQAKRVTWVIKNVPSWGCMFRQRINEELVLE